MLIEFIFSIMMRTEIALSELALYLSGCLLMALHTLSSDLDIEFLIF
jgi:hypothetical protein